MKAAGSGSNSQNERQDRDSTHNVTTPTLCQTRNATGSQCIMVMGYHRADEEVDGHRCDDDNGHGDGVSQS